MCEIDNKIEFVGRCCYPMREGALVRYRTKCPAHDESIGNWVFIDGAIEAMMCDLLESSDVACYDLAWHNVPDCLYMRIIALIYKEGKLIDNLSQINA